MVSSHRDAQVVPANGVGCKFRNGSVLGKRLDNFIWRKVVAAELAELGNHLAAHRSGSALAVAGVLRFRVATEGFDVDVQQPAECEPPLTGSILQIQRQSR